MAQRHTPETNVEFVTRLMEYCPYGALGQVFLIQAIDEYARQVASAATIEGNDLISGEVWKKVGTWVHRELTARFEPPRSNQEA